MNSLSGFLLYNWLRQAWILLEELHNAVSQLRMINRQALDFMQWQKSFEQESLVFFFQRQCETVNYWAENLQ